MSERFARVYSDADITGIVPQENQNHELIKYNIIRFLKSDLKV